MVNSQALTSLAADAGFFVSGVASKKATTALGINAVTFMSVMFNFVPVLVVILISGSGPSVPIFDILLSAIAGIFLVAGLILIFKALHTETLTATIAMGEIWPAILVMLGIFFLGESLTIPQLLAIVLIFGGVIFVITTKGFQLNRKLIPAMLANILWGIYWIILTYAIQGSNNFAIPILITRIVAIVVMALYVLSNSSYKNDIKNLFSNITKKPSNKLAFILLLGLLTSLGDGTGDTIIASVINMKTAAIAGAIVALSPLFISISAYFIYKDRLTKLQYLGFVAMVIGAVILSAS